LSPAPLSIAPDWSLFLDRDGVINRRLVDEYVRRWDEFEFLPGVLPALGRLAGLFRTIVIVTNQRGIGRGLMTEADLADIHGRMLDAVRAAGGRIDRIYHCPHDLSAACACRKPKTELFARARADFPELEPTRSIMVGDSSSDLQFAINAGLHGVWIGDTPPALAVPPLGSFPDLDAFSRAL
jgi:D-glycero-D-manno-heptose 1,7-bisphosphate phosphatase